VVISTLHRRFAGLFFENILKMALRRKTQCRCDGAERIAAHRQQAPGLVDTQFRYVRAGADTGIILENGYQIAPVQSREIRQFLHGDLSAQVLEAVTAYLPDEVSSVLSISFKRIYMLLN
jgi:hypothetical protein